MAEGGSTRQQVDKVLNMDDSSQLKEIDKICNIVEDSPKLKEMLKEKSLSLLLLGKTGEGKSSVGNMILYTGKDIFVPNEPFASFESSESGTKEVTKHSGIINQRPVTVVDTPGTCDTTEDKATTLKEIAAAVANSPDGYDAFIFVVKYPIRWTHESREAVNQLEKLFTAKVFDYAIFLATGGDNYNKIQKRNAMQGKTPTTFVEEVRAKELTDRDDSFAKFANRCKGGVIMFNCFEEDWERRGRDVEALLSMIESMKQANGNVKYTNHIFEYAQRQPSGRALNDRVKDILGYIIQIPDIFTL